MKAHLKDIHAWQSYLMGQLDALVQKLPRWGDSSQAAASGGSPHEAKALAQEMTTILVDRLLTSDVLSLTRMGLLKGDRVAALLDDPTVPHPTPCHLALRLHDLNVN